MIVLFDSPPKDALTDLGAEAGLPPGQLLTPLTRYTNRAVEEGLPWAIDNGAFAGFNPKAWRSLLAREYENRASCLFVAMPDIVGSARRTLELFWAYHGETMEWPRALVAQDGIGDLVIPWSDIVAVFIGGTDAFKTSADARHVILTAKALGKHTHVGRVNSADRFKWCVELGVDTIDGSGISQYSHMRRKLAGDPDQTDMEFA